MILLIAKLSSCAVRMSKRICEQQLCTGVMEVLSQAEYWSVDIIKAIFAACADCMQLPFAHLKTYPQ